MKRSVMKSLVNSYRQSKCSTMKSSGQRVGLSSVGSNVEGEIHGSWDCCC